MNLTNFATFACLLTIAVALIILVAVRIGSGENAYGESTTDTTAVETTVCETTEAPVMPETTEAVTVPEETAVPETSEPTVPETTETTEATETEETMTYFDVPLSHDLQDHIFNLCEMYDVDPALIVAIIKRESTYRADVIGDNGNSFGLMQIQPRWHQDRMDDLGVTDLLNPYQNVEVGIDYFAELLDKGKSVEWALMAYNSGPSNANKKAANGEVSSYAKSVLKIADELRGE